MDVIHVAINGLNGDRGYPASASYTDSNGGVHNLTIVNKQVDTDINVAPYDYITINASSNHYHAYSKYMGVAITKVQ